MTDISNQAALYSKSNYVFINEVMESQKLETVFHKDFTNYPSFDCPAEFPFAKHVMCGGRLLGEGDYKTDVYGRRYRNVAGECGTISL